MTTLRSDYYMHSYGTSLHLHVGVEMAGLRVQLEAWGQEENIQLSDLKRTLEVICIC